MSSHDIKSAERPAPDAALVAIADYAKSFKIDSAQAYETAAGGLDGSLPLLVAGVNQVRNAVSGQAEQAFVDSMDQYTNSNPGYLFVASKWGYAYTADWRLDASVNELIRPASEDLFR